MNIKNHLSSFTLRGNITNKTYYPLSDKRSKVYLSSVNLTFFTNNSEYA